MIEDVLVPSDGENNPDLAVIIMNPDTVSSLGRPNWAYQSKEYQSKECLVMLEIFVLT